MDLVLLTYFNEILVHPLLDKLMVGLTVGGLGLLPVLGLALLLRQGQRQVGLAVLTSLMVSLAWTLAFQFLVLRPRPEAVRLLLPTPNFPSYPSGHAAAAFGAALVIGLSYRHWLGWGLALSGAGLIAYSRVYLGHHYPSDVLAGAMIGAGVGAACYGLIVAGRRSAGGSIQPGGADITQPSGRFDWQWLLWPQIALALVITQMAYLGLIPAVVFHWPLVDKVMHFVLIGSIAFWLNLWLRGRTVRVGSWAVPLAILIPLSVALVEELFQHFSPLRTADPIDFLSDVAGLVFFWWVSQRIVTKTKSVHRTL